MAPKHKHSKDENPTDEHLKDEQTIFDNIKKKYEFRVHNELVKALTISSYELNDYRASKAHFTGKIYFEGDDEKEASFFQFKESEGHIAKKIYKQASKLTDDGILTPRFVTYYKPKKIWILCFDKFDSLLSDNITNIVLPEEDRGDSIRKLLRSINYVHRRRLFHGALKERCDYAIISGQIKIIFTSILFTWDDLQIPKKSKGDEEKVENLRIKDLTDFRDMLKKLILESEVDWEDQESFFQFFDKNAEFWHGYQHFVDQLIKHPSLMNSERRTKYYFEIEQSIVTFRLRKASVLMSKLEGEEFSEYINWTYYLSESDILDSIYDYQGVNYKGEKVRDLIRFLANAYAHYESQNYEYLDLDIRRLYPDFLNRLHKYL